MMTDYIYVFGSSCGKTESPLRTLDSDPNVVMVSGTDEPNNFTEYLAALREARASKWVGIETTGVDGEIPVIVRGIDINKLNCLKPEHDQTGLKGPAKPYFRRGRW